MPIYSYKLSNKVYYCSLLLCISMCNNLLILFHLIVDIQEQKAHSRTTCLILIFIPVSQLRLNLPSSQDERKK